jgi:AcrR family transcriptional regulator
VTSQPEPALGLRERKKAKTRAAIREHAMRLFREHGYAETTVDQIADAAEVSPSTFFRYFPTKEDVVLEDDFHTQLLAAMRAQPAELSPIDAVREALTTVFGGMSDAVKARERERNELIKSVPELHGAVLDKYTYSLRQLAAIVAERLGRDPSDFPVRVFSGAIVGVVLATVDSGVGTALPDYAQLLDRALRLLAAGLPL